MSSLCSTGELSISQIETYHWNNGAGDLGPGQISVWLNTPAGRRPVAPNNAFTVQVEPGAFGVPANWVANINPGAGGTGGRWHGWRWRGRRNKSVPLHPESVVRTVALPANQ